MTPGCRLKDFHCGKAGQTLHRCFICLRPVCAACSIRTDVREQGPHGAEPRGKQTVCNDCAVHESAWAVPGGADAVLKHMRTFGSVALPAVKPLTKREINAAKKRRERERASNPHVYGRRVTVPSTAPRPAQRRGAEPPPYPADRMEPACPPSKLP
jgi:hypothetical protein